MIWDWSYLLAGGATDGSVVILVVSRYLVCSNRGGWIYAVRSVVHGLKTGGNSSGDLGLKKCWSNNWVVHVTYIPCDSS